MILEPTPAATEEVLYNNARKRDFERRMSHHGVVD